MGSMASIRSIRAAIRLHPAAVVEQSPTSAPYIVHDPKHLFDNVARQMAGGATGYIADFDQAYPGCESPNGPR